MLKAVLASALIAIALAGPALPAGLDACPQGVEAVVGRKARITLASGSFRSGKILSVSPAGIVLRSHAEEQTLDTASIDRIEVRSRAKTVRNVLLTAVGGALAGLLFGGGHDEADSDSLAILFGWIGAVGGAGAGAALPARTVVCD